MSRSRTALIGLLCLSVVGTACSLAYPPPEAAPATVAASDPSPVPPSSTTTGTASRPAASPSAEGLEPGPAAPPVSDAAAFRDALLEIAERSLGADPGSRRDFGVVSAWEDAYPRVEFTNYALKATRKSVSVFTNLVEPGTAPGAGNPYLIAFSVRDKRGRCTGGILIGFPRPAAARSVEPAGSTGCTAIDTAEAGGFALL